MITTEAQRAREQYDDLGYAIFRNVLPAELVDEARSHVLWLMDRYPDVRPEELHHTLMRDDPFWVRLIQDSSLLDVAELFIGQDIALFASHYICKPPRTGRPVLWHQDGSYWPLEPMDVVSLWLAVDDSTPENGCMRVVPSTHRDPLVEVTPYDDEPNVLHSRLDPSHVDESRAVDVILRAGDVSVHHPNLIHGSHGNTSEKRRCGLTIRYIPTSTRVTSEDFFDNLFLLRGSPRSGINDYRPFPAYREGSHMPFAGCDAWA